MASLPGIFVASLALLTVSCEAVKTAPNSFKVPMSTVMTFHSRCLNNVALTTHASKPETSKQFVVYCAQRAQVGPSNFGAYKQALHSCLQDVPPTAPSNVKLAISEIALTYTVCLNNSVANMKTPIPKASTSGSKTTGGIIKKKTDGLPPVHPGARRGTS